MAVPPIIVTVTVTGPAEPAGAVILIVVAVLAVMIAALLPKVTEAPFKFNPVIFTNLPEVVGPDAGEMPVIIGAAT